MHQIRGHYILKKSLVILLVLILLLPETVLPLEIVINKNMNLRNQETQVVGLLKKGSVVEIPDAFVKKNPNGSVNFQATVDNWLKQPGTLLPNADFTDTSNPQLKTKEHFFPITVKTAASGSDYDPKKFAGSKQPYISLTFLSRLGDGIGFTVKQDAQVVQPPTMDAQTRMESKQKPLCPKGQIGKTLDELSSILKKLSSSKNLDNLSGNLKPLLSEAQSRTVELNTADTSADLKHNFESTCGGSFSEFEQILKTNCEKEGIPFSLAKAFMMRESKGLCFTSKENRQANLGLFQINKEATLDPLCKDKKFISSLPGNIQCKPNFPICTPDQFKNSTPSDWQKGIPPCIENPVINMRTSFYVLNSKSKVVASKQELSGIKSIKALTPEARDAIRFKVFAYNAGEGEYGNIIRRINNANKFNGTHYNPSKWEDFRLFLFTNYINRDDKKQIGIKDMGPKELRSQIDRIAYVEDIMGREGIEASPIPSLVQFIED